MNEERSSAANLLNWNLVWNTRQKTCTIKLNTLVAACDHRLLSTTTRTRSASEHVFWTRLKNTNDLVFSSLRCSLVPCAWQWSVCKLSETVVALQEDVPRREGPWPLRCCKQRAFHGSWRHQEFFTDLKGSVISRGMSCEPTCCRAFYKLQAALERRQMSDASSRSDWIIKVSLVQEVKVRTKWRRSHFWRKVSKAPIFLRNGILLGRLPMLVTLSKIWFRKGAADFADPSKPWSTPAVTYRFSTRMEMGQGILQSCKPEGT